MKKTRLVLDTNILVYGINEESEFFEKIREILESERYTFYISSKTISEFTSVFSKMKRYDIIENELPKIIRQHFFACPLFFPSNLVQ